MTIPRREMPRFYSETLASRRRTHLVNPRDRNRLVIQERERAKNERPPTLPALHLEVLNAKGILSRMEDANACALEPRWLGMLLSGSRQG